MRPRLSPWLSLKCGVKRVKMRFFGCFRPVFGFSIFALRANELEVLRALAFDYVQVAKLTLIAKQA
jgi:hypothetical protein